MKVAIRTLFTLALCLSLAFALGCGKKPREAVGIYDTPEHHYKLGISYVDSEDLDKADVEFDKALELDKKYGPALAGKGLVLAMRGEMDKSFDLIDDGRDEADNDQEEVWAIMAEIRAYGSLMKNMLIDTDDGVDEAEDAYDDGMDIVEDDRSLGKEEAGLNYFMGQAYVYGLEFTKAADMFTKVKTMKQGYEEEADKLWNLIQRAIRVSPGTAVGKRIALVDKLSRADMAALLVEELNIRRFYARTEQPQESQFEPPKSGLEMDDLYTKKGITDIDGHPMRGDIREAIELGVKGLQPYPDHTFRPQEHLSRAEVAMIIEDVIIRATGKEDLATKFIGQKSQFPDVRGDHPYFNAVTLATTRGLMNADLRTGLFRPMDPVPGVEALEAVMKLKQQLNPF